jgi:hypothetical protein
MSAVHKRQRPLQRRDATGHLDPKYAADLRSRSLENAKEGEDLAFLARAKSSDPLAAALGEEFVEAATTGEDAGQEVFNQGIPEEEGGPFVVTRGRDEFAHGSDRSNPKDATREPFPRVSGDQERNQADEDGDHDDPEDQDDIA